MAGREFDPHADILQAYRAIDPTIAAGGLSVAQYQEIRVAAGEPAELGPGARNDYAWLTLETSMAMVRADDPATSKPYKTSERNAMANAARAAFESVVQDETAPLLLRVQAQIAHASIPTYLESRQTRGIQTGSTTVGPYVAGLQRAGRALVEQEGPNEAETDQAAILATLGIATAHTAGHAYFLPAAPRQPWAITAITRRSGHHVHVVIGEEAPEGTVALPGEVLIDARVGETSMDSLRAFVDASFTFSGGRKFVNEGRLAQRDIADRINKVIGEQATQMTRAAHAAGSAALAEASRSERPEIAWYKTQPAGDLRNMPETTLRVNLANLDDAAERGELSAAELHVLAWMRVDAARVLAMQAEERRAAAAAKRLEADRGSAYDRPGRLVEAEGIDQQQATLLAQARQRFAGAREAVEAALATQQNQPGHVAELSVDIAAFNVYEALYVDGTAEAVNPAVKAYVQRVAEIGDALAFASRRLRRGDPKLEIAYSAASRLSMVLLSATVNDESARHLILTTGVRGGGPRGEAQAIILPYDFGAAGGYDLAPVTLNLTGDSRLEHEPHHVEFGLKRIFSRSEFIIPTLLSLTTAAKKRHALTPALNTQGMNLSYAVADASA